MPDDDFDRRLLDAWERAYHRFKDDPEALARVIRRRGRSTYSRPLRSWSLVLRANDKRIDDDSTQGLVRVTVERVRALCSPVVIRWPGVSLDEAAALLGVNRTTVARWASPDQSATAWRHQTWWQHVQSQMAVFADEPEHRRPATYTVTGRRLMLDYHHNRANPKRSKALVWTPGYAGIDPAGEVWSGPWGGLRRGLADRVSDGFSQQLQRVDRVLGCHSTRVMQWRCPELDAGCGRLADQLYLPMPNWTLVDALVGGDERLDGQSVRFRCRRCAGLIYESAERGSTPGRRRDGARRRVDIWDRFIRRLSAGVLTGQDMAPESTPARSLAGAARWSCSARSGGS